MHLEQLAQHAIDFVTERPSLGQQLEDPLIALEKLIEELHELRPEIIAGNVRNILDELTDAENYFATLQYVLFKVYGFTADQIVQHSHYKYAIRNHLKYPPIGYQNGTPPDVQQKRDCNRWASAASRGADPEQVLGGEYY
jgi:hypothetical protein